MMTDVQQDGCLEEREQSLVKELDLHFLKEIQALAKQQKINMWGKIIVWKDMQYRQKWKKERAIRTPHNSTM